MRGRATRRNRVRATRLTRRGWALLIVGLVCVPVAYLIHRQEILSVGCFVLLLPVCAWLYVRLRTMRISVRRVFSPPAVSAGHPATVELEVTNASTVQTSEAHWRDNWPWSPYANEPGLLPSLRPRLGRDGGRGSSVRLRYPVSPPVRGVFEVGPLLLDFSDPFGLADGAIAVGSTDTLVVTPEIVPLPEGMVSVTADEGPTRMMERRALGAEDDLMTREYRRGDALRRVHWRASAHHGELMVRQEEQRSHAEARLVLDTRGADYPDARPSGDAGEPESDSFEWAVGFLASLALHLQRGGFLVTVIETAENQLADVDHAEEFLESLAAVRLLDGQTGPISLLHGADRPDRSQGSVFAVLADADPAILDRLIAQRRSFHLAVAFLLDPLPATSARLREAGWICIEVDAEQPMDLAWLRVGAELDAGRGHA